MLCWVPGFPEAMQGARNCPVLTFESTFCYAMLLSAAHQLPAASAQPRLHKPPYGHMSS